MDMLEFPRNSNCSIAHSLAAVGQKWTLLILREALLGRTRFADFRAIGVPSDVLTSRLNGLVADGLLERRPYRAPGERERFEYVITDAGRDLLPVLASLVAWGDKHALPSDRPFTRFVNEATGREVELRFVDEGEVIDDPNQVRIVHDVSAAPATVA